MEAALEARQMLVTLIKEASLRQEDNSIRYGKLAISVMPVRQMSDKTFFYTFYINVPLILATATTAKTIRILFRTIERK